ncbi:FimB/Mfa2 family fimbrial subunit [Bacteroides faecium]|uniref:FimB/Mfa2 family fimbrial subunit n=1 Tax=Bacteroides faecium TaxID=2715212 RepID=A0A6H0KPB9_9BACE|nr:FimB/Mfa2 family fimbrial subunit [Bacteroides faecium]QIU94871.1 FimB/Mfa2 family fimbrial subunit [Bacteroides faecium]
MTRIRLQSIFPFLALAGFVLVFYGCMKEDYSDCGLYLQFKYTHNPEQTDKLREVINTIDVFAFDAGGTFVGQWKHDPSSGKELHLKLEKGIYTLVAWGNISEQFSYSLLQPGVTTMDEAILSLRRDADNIVTDSPQPLYHAIMGDLNMKNIGMQRMEMDFYHNVNHIEVNLEGLPISATSTGMRAIDPAPGTRFTLLVTGSNGDYKFDNSRWELAPTLTYLPQYSQSGKRLTAAFSLMRLSREDDTRIVLLHTEDDGSKRELYSASLSDLLMNNPKLDFDIDSEFQLNLKFDYSYTLIGITVNEWNSVDADDGQGGTIG